MGLEEMGHGVGRPPPVDLERGVNGEESSLPSSPLSSSARTILPSSFPRIHVSDPPAPGSRPARTAIRSARRRRFTIAPSSYTLAAVCAGTRRFPFGKANVVIVRFNGLRAITRKVITKCGTDWRPELVICRIDNEVP